MLIKKQNNLKQSSMLIEPVGFLSSPELMYLVFCLKDYGRFDFKNVFLFVFWYKLSVA